MMSFRGHLRADNYIHLTSLHRLNKILCDLWRTYQMLDNTAKRSPGNRNKTSSANCSIRTTSPYRRYGHIAHSLAGEVPRDRNDDIASDQPDDARPSRVTMRTSHPRTAGTAQGEWGVTMSIEKQ